jgi:hypothetical protein
MGYSAKIVLDSVGPNKARLTTFELTYPRFVHAELMTHRVFSRNAASSRAIPTEKLLSMIEEGPAMPVWWGKNESGMQAREELSGDALWNVKVDWLSGRNMMVALARGLGRLGLHKQIANRVAEPWMFITVLVTATEFGNFFGLRDHAAAQPELAYVAAQAHQLYKHNVPHTLDIGGWHLPLVTGNDEEALRLDFNTGDICRISIGRCARVSYLTHDGKRDPHADIELAGRLQKSGHMSPFEHVAMALTAEQWSDYGAKLAHEWVANRIPTGNLWGWHQYRKTLQDEHDFSLLHGAKK